MEPLSDGHTRSPEGLLRRRCWSYYAWIHQLYFWECIFLCSMSSMLPPPPLLPHLALPISLHIFSSPPCIVLAWKTGCGRGEVNLLWPGIPSWASPSPDFFWLSLSRPTRAASCNTIQMEYSKKKAKLPERERPSVAPSPHLLSSPHSFFFNKQLFVSAAFLVSCRLCLWADRRMSLNASFQKPSWLFFLFLPKYFCIFCSTIVNRDLRPNKGLI